MKSAGGYPSFSGNLIKPLFAPVGKKKKSTTKKQTPKKPKRKY